MPARTAPVLALSLLMATAGAGSSGCAGCRSPAPAAAAAQRPPARGSEAPLQGLEAADERPRSGGTLRVRAMSEPAGLNPLDDAFRSAWTVRITRNLVYESLVDLDPHTLELRPGLAASWVQSGDRRVVTFTLRAGVRFHDGSAFSAADVVAVLDAVADRTRPTASLRAELGDLVRWHAVAPQTVVLEWGTPSPFDLRRLAQLPMLPAQRLAGDWSLLASRPVGTGPYRLERWERGTRLSLARAGDPHDGRALVDRISFHFVRDPTVATQLFDKGELDLLTAVPPFTWRAMETAAPSARAGRRARLLRSVDNSYSFIAWNQRRPPLDDVRVRRALARLYPSRLIAQAVDLGLEPPTSCPYYAEGGHCDDHVDPVPFDPPLARRELEQAGFSDADGDGVLERDGRPLRLRLLVAATSTRLSKVAAILHEQGRRAGVAIVPEPVDAATLGARIAAADFDAVSRLWTEFDVESDQAPHFHSAGIARGTNVGGHRSDVTDALLEAVRAEWNPARRRALERAVHRQLALEQPVLFMTNRQSLDAASLDVRGLRPSVLWYDLRRVWLAPPAMAASLPRTAPFP